MSKCMRNIICILFLCFIIPSTYAGLIERVSVSSNEDQGSGSAFSLSFSADFRFVAFSSEATNLVVGDTNGTRDIFVHDRDTGITKRVSVSSSGLQGNSFSSRSSISADGRFVAFWSHASNLVTNDTGNSDVFVHDRSTGMTERVSVTSTGEQADGDSYGVTSISADGRFVAFESEANNLVFPNSRCCIAHIFVHDRDTGINELVDVSSSGAQGNGTSSHVSISADGRFVAFNSIASNLVADDTNANIDQLGHDIFVHDRSRGITERVSVSSSGEQGNHKSDFPSISADGRFVAFSSLASNLVVGDTYRTGDVFVHDRETGVTERVSVSSSGLQGNQGISGSSISADGRFVAFDTRASNLVDSDTNGYQDVFVHDRDTSTTERFSVSSNGEQGNDNSWGPLFSTDGRFVAFSSNASNLVAGDTNLATDVFVAENPLRPINRVFQEVKSLGDINADGSEDIAVLVQNVATGTVTAIVKDAEDDHLIQQISFSSTRKPGAFEVMPDIDGNGAPELVVLGDELLVVQIYDSLSGALQNAVTFNSNNITPIDLVVLPDQNGNGIPELAVLARSRVNGSVTVVVTDAITNQTLNYVGFSSNFIPLELAVLADLNSNAQVEFAVLGVEATMAGHDKVEIRDSATHTVVNNVFYSPTVQAKHLVVLPDQNNNGVEELAVLREGRYVIVQINDALTDSHVNHLGVNPSFTYSQVLVIPDLNGNGVAEIGVLGTDPTANQTRVEITDAKTTAKISVVFFDNDFKPQGDVALVDDINGNGSAELAYLGQRESDGKLRVIIRDSLTKAVINTVDF